MEHPFTYFVILSAAKDLLFIQQQHEKGCPIPIAQFAIGWESTNPELAQITCQEQQTKFASISLILNIRNNPEIGMFPEHIR